MTSKAEWLALAERCEKAMEPDREIDWCIHAAILNWPAEIKPRQPGDAEYTASLDAITALIERELPDFHWRIQGGCKKTGWIQMSGDPRAYIKSKAKDYKIGFDGEAATPALALCAAFCRAMAEAAE
jgi:hypothetical protein